MWVRVWNCVSVLRRSLGVSCADDLRIVPGVSFRVKILCSLMYTETFALRIELASGSDVTGSEDGVSGLWWVKVDINGQGDVSGQRSRAMDRVRFSESCGVRVLIRLDCRFLSKVRATVQFSCRITVRQGWYSWWSWRIRPQVCARVRVM